MSVLDKWILNKAKQTFDEIEKAFSLYEFSKGLNKLNNFLVVDLSGMYMDVCKDRLYCDGQFDIHRTGAQTAMAMIAKKLFSCLAPILTYTIDELLEYAPKIIKNDAKDVFDLNHYELPEVESKLNEELLINAKEKFSEAIDTLKKDKTIKTTLELVLYTSSQELQQMCQTELADWFLVSEIVKEKYADCKVSFSVDGCEFEVYLSDKHKCPRCWKFTAHKEDELCDRCSDVVNK
jgi:isoleucyl-tRNA synthetase